MGKKVKKKELSNPHLKNLKRDLANIQKGERYLAREKEKLAKDKERVMGKIRKEKEILQLKGKIKRLQNRKK
jgi:hypothetical protein